MRNQPLSAPSDENIVAFPGSKQELDIGRLFDAHGPYLCRVLHRLTGSREAAEDVVQEVFLLAYHRRNELEDRAGIRTWLYRAAVNHVRHRRRSFSRYQGLLDRYQQHPVHKDQAEGPEEVASRTERGRLVQECVMKLSDKLREVFVLYELEELEGNQIAALLGIPVNTVWTRLHHGRKRFEDAMRKRIRRDDHVA